jgi:hypothetical protein
MKSHARIPLIMEDEKCENKNKNNFPETSPNKLYMSIILSLN